MAAINLRFIATIEDIVFMLRCFRLPAAALLLLFALSAGAADPVALVNAGLTFDIDIPYGAESEAQKLDILYPSDPETPLRPAIVHIHGGGWYTGGKGGEKTFALMKGFADNGYVALSIAYRLSDEAKFPAAVEDCKLAVRWLRKNGAKYRVNPDAIGATGTSAGGHLSALLAVTGETDTFDGEGAYGEYSSAIQAAVPVCGPMDLRKPLSLKLGLENDDAVMRFLDGTPLEKPELARQASPAAYVRAGMPPLFLIHGQEDRRVEPVQSSDFAEAVRAAGSPCEIALVEGGKHGSDIARTPDMLERVQAFFDTHLKP